MKYSFLAMVGRRYLITWVDQNWIRTTADVSMTVNKMAADEHIVFQFSQRPPLYPRLVTRSRVWVKSPELWGEQQPRLGAWSPVPKVSGWGAYCLASVGFRRLPVASCCSQCLLLVCRRSTDTQQ